ncbi:MAG TPA: hypothetical protein VEA44_07130 [Caulobacter sp.]|nr:hypothetical protein [Caulobacter sp.]
MAKKRKNRLPKRVAGVKVPKTLRKGRIGKFLVSPEGQKLVAQGLAAAGAMVAASQAPRAVEAAKEPMADAKHAGEEAAHKVGEAGATLGQALTAAALAFAETLRGEHRSFRAEPEDPPTVTPIRARPKGESPATSPAR